MKTNVVYKYEIPGNDYQMIRLPKDAKPFSVINQNDKIVMYVLRDYYTKSVDLIDRVFITAGTGQTIKDNIIAIIGTFTIENLVFHLMEVELTTDLSYKLMEK